MFYALAIAVCLAVFFLGMAGISLLLLPAIRALRHYLFSSSGASSGIAANFGTAANILFGVRLLPLAIACALTLGLALPAFLVFEPHSTKEGIGWQLAILAGLGGLVAARIMARAWRILRDTMRTQRAWLEHSERMKIEGIDLPVFRLESGSALLAVAGIFRPRIFVSSEITKSLTIPELRAALAHEIAHASSLDNLKQFLLKITRPPRWMKSLHDVDLEWTGASEVAADRAALLRGASVFDLSSALIKAGRLQRPLEGMEAVASHLAPPACGYSLEMRITRLSEMLQREQMPVQAAKRSSPALPVLFAVIAYLACIQAILPGVHDALEFLVR
jgi:hypothetical protein